MLTSIIELELFYECKQGRLPKVAHMQLYKPLYEKKVKWDKQTDQRMD